MYQKSTSSGDLRHIEIALEHGREPVHFNGVIYLLWGFIFAKLFILEFCVQVYDIPFNSTLFIWSLTLIFAAVCTGVYLNVLRQRMKKKPLTNALIVRIWTAVFVPMVLITLVGVITRGFNLYLLPAGIAFGLGTGYLIHGYLNQMKLFRLLGIGWWMAGITLALMPGVESLAWMALFILLLQIIPTAYLQFSPANRRLAAQAEEE